MRRKERIVIRANYIDITGTIETLPKIAMVDGKKCCEFLLRSRAYVKSNEIKECFSIMVLLSRKNSRRCLAKYRHQIGREVRLEGSLSFNTDPDRLYSGFYINVAKITGLL